MDVDAYGLRKGFEAEAEMEEVEDEVEAASNCSRADCGRMILSPFRSLEEDVVGEATSRVADHLIEGWSAISSELDSKLE